ncbi:uncharacterized protein LOC129250710 [Anastrepha obliqua]|uniref:uncharacterized protein LOC129250710 n=1 Tax=Anastrepha obliqua TaxID=95512 RepID=UPI00240A91BB|nr:uncharacterized protein LOC129250710 [Anastrepha obliqua]
MHKHIKSHPHAIATETGKQQTTFTRDLDLLSPSRHETEPQPSTILSKKSALEKFVKAHTPLDAENDIYAENICESPKKKGNCPLHNQWNANFRIRMAEKIIQNSASCCFTLFAPTKDHLIS